MLPKITHLFRLTREPELRYSQSGTALCKIGLVASEKYKDKENTLFIDATAFGNIAELINNVQKGQRIFVTGRLQTEEWQDNNGQKRSKISMTIENFEYVEKRDNSQQVEQQYSQPQGGHSAPHGQYQHHQTRMPENTMPEISIDEDTLPF
jgi:single-strand DNA-binding protein